MTDTKDLIGNTDALEWAEQFCTIFKGQTIDTEDHPGTAIVDIGGMIGWFANAIMAGFDEGYSREQRDMARLKYALDHHWTRPQYESACEKDLWEEDALSDILPSIQGTLGIIQGTLGIKSKSILGDACEYELLPMPARFCVAEIEPEVETSAPTEHFYADEDIAHLAQEREDLLELLGDILAHSPVCDYNTEEWCIEHRTGRPCPFGLARSYINGK